MIYNDEVLAIENSVSDLSKKINQSHLVDAYLTSFEAMAIDSEVTKIRDDFLSAKEKFERVEPYGKYAPDFKETRRAVRKAKRQLDTNELVSEFKYNETSLQNMLDYLTFDIAKSISDDIKIDAGNPFFEFAKRGCGGNCHVG
ncbi:MULTISPECIES: YlbF family regulator [Vagococcus]|uniref:YlbF family regulator n=1 Tax=Vagococcus TaxID=2737 RepID=UPI002FCB91C5